jgi:hypothetical protein
MKCLLVAVLYVSAIAAAAEGAEKIDPWLGTWVNVDPDTRGTTRFVISQGKNGRKIHVWGRCHPQDCDWGETSLVSIDSGAPRQFVIWDKKFVDVYLTLRLENEEIALDNISIYKDGSGRRNFCMQYRFKRSEE